jgi:iron complex outermembrane receptor protein
MFDKTKNKSIHIRFPKYLIIAIVLGCSVTIAQKNITGVNNYTFYGKIFDKENNQPLIGAEVFIPDKEVGSVTANDGSYKIDYIPEGEYDVKVKLIGYKEQNFKLQLFKDTKQDFYLESSVINLQQVTIEGERKDSKITNHSIVVLSDEQLNKARGQTLGETLSQLPGVTTLQTGPSISKPVIRGLQSERIIVVNAGVSQEGQQWGAEHAPEIDPFAPSKVEVIKGAASIEYGAGAIGGVINIEPRELPTVSGLNGTLQLSGYSNNMQGATSLLIADALNVLPGFAWQIQGSYRKAGSSKSPYYILGNTAFEELDGNLTLGYAVNNLNLKAYYSHFGTTLGIYTGSHIGNYADLERAISYGRPPADYPFTYEIKPPDQVISHDLWSINLGYNFPEVGKLDIIYGWQSNHRQEFDARRFWTDSVTIAPRRAAFDLVLTTYSADIKFKHDPISNFYGTIGITGMRQTNVGNSLSFLIPNFRSYSGGIYLIENWLLNDLAFNAGLRYDYRQERIYPYEPKNIPNTQNIYNSITAAFGVNYSLTQNISLAGNIESAWRPPSINEMYSNGVHHGTAQYEIGNQSLGSEHSTSTDIILRYNDRKISGEISVYYNYINNFIFLLPSLQPTLTLRGLFPTFIYEQANSTLKGFDGNIEYQLLDFYSLGLTYSVVRGDNLETKEPLFQMPADRLKIINHFTIPDFSAIKNNYMEIGAVLVAKQTRYPANVDYLPPPEGYILFNFEIGGEINLFSSLPAQVNLSINNLFDTSYRDYLSRFRYYVDDPGRNLIIRINIPFGNIN